MQQTCIWDRGCPSTMGQTFSQHTDSCESWSDFCWNRTVHFCKSIPCDLHNTTSGSSVWRVLYILCNHLEFSHDPPRKLVLVSMTRNLFFLPYPPFFFLVTPAFLLRKTGHLSEWPSEWNERQQGSRLWTTRALSARSYFPLLTIEIHFKTPDLLPLLCCWQLAEFFHFEAWLCQWLRKNPLTLLTWGYSLVLFQPPGFATCGIRIS